MSSIRIDTLLNMTTNIFRDNFQSLFGYSFNNGLNSGF